MITTAVKKASSAKRSAATPSAPIRSEHTIDRSKTGAEISQSSLEAFPSMRSIRIANDSYRSELERNIALEPLPFNLKDTKRNLMIYTVRDVVSSVAIAILGTALVFVVIWLLWFALGA